MITTALVSVATTATQLAAVSGPSTPAVGASGRNRVMISVPTGGQTVFLGGSDVTASGAKQGLPALSGGVTVVIELAYDDVLYGIVAATTQNANVLVTEI